MNRRVMLHGVFIFLATFGHGLPADEAEEANPVPVPPEAPIGAVATEAAELPDTSHLVSWLESVDRARELGRARRSPVVIVAGAEWCGPCRLLEEQIAQPVVQDALERCVAVHLNIDEQEEAAAELAVTSIPAIRVLSPDGHLLASHEGLMDADALAEWLNEQFDAISQGQTDADSGGKLTALAARRMMHNFRSQESSVRESTLSRLAAVPGLAAPFVVAAISDGNLSEQLSCLELLSLWNAPVEDLDPWVPDTLTAERIERLQTWLDANQFRDPAAVEELSAAELVEIERLLKQLEQADSVSAAALREQLARFGSRTLPLILDMLNETAEDEVKQRLNAARFRVVSSPELEVKWPGGIERLASVNYDIRVKAAVELSKLATNREDQLLGELLRDPMPLIREIGLEGLAGISRSSANGALAKLLDDPDANVRAAVLKRLADKPSPALAKRVAEYVAEESDPDLVVHAVRFLREVSTAHAVESLSSLLNHSSWRVRAESADGLMKLVEKNRYGTNSLSGLKAPLAKKFEELLTDEDEFVIGRAVSGLAALNASSAVPAIIEVAETREKLTPQIVKALGKEFAGSRDGQDFVRDMCLHNSGEVRSEAIQALIESNAESSSSEIEDCLSDVELRVRKATADAMFESAVTQVVSKLRAVRVKKRERESQTAEIEEMTDGSTLGRALNAISSLFGGNETSTEEEISAADEPKVPDAEDDRTQDQNASPVDLELRRIRNDKDLGNWLFQHNGDLIGLLQSPDSGERLSAARLLAVLGVEDGFPVLLKCAEDPTHLMSVAMTLPGLLWEEKQQLFERMMAVSQNDADRMTAVEALSHCHEPRSSKLIWPLLSRADMDGLFAGSLRDLLKQAYFPEPIYQLEDADASSVQQLADDCRQMLAEGTSWQQTLALSLLAEADTDGGIAAAEAVLSDAQQSESRRDDSLRVFLFHSDTENSTSKAVEILSSEPVGGALAKSAVGYLGFSKAGVDRIAESVALTVRGSSDSDDFDSRNTYGGSDEMPKWIVSRAPSGLTVEQILPFVESDDHTTAASAAYLLVLLGKKEYLPRLVDSWSPSEDADGDTERRLIYRAIAASNDSQYVPVLKRVYQNMMADEYRSDVFDFYWTIRVMTGPDVLALRKQIRQEVGAERLKSPYGYLKSPYGY